MCIRVTGTRADGDDIEDTDPQRSGDIETPVGPEQPDHCEREKHEHREIHPELAVTPIHTGLASHCSPMQGEVRPADHHPDDDDDFDRHIVERAD